MIMFLIKKMVKILINIYLVKAKVKINLISYFNN